MLFVPRELFAALVDETRESLDADHLIHWRVLGGGGVPISQLEQTRSSSSCAGTSPCRRIFRRASSTSSRSYPVSEPSTPVCGVPMPMHHRDDADVRIEFDEHDRVRKPHE